MKHGIDSAAGTVRPSTPAVASDVFGDRLPLAERYVDLLVTDGIQRGVIGPHEVPRIWPRHILNCAVVHPAIPAGAVVADVGSGAGLPGGGAVHVKSLVRDGDRYFALTAEDGVFASDAVTAGAPAPAPDVLALTASPNPTAGATAVSLTLPVAGEARVAIFDALGRRVAVLHDGPLSAGRHTLALDAAVLPAGAYVVRDGTVRWEPAIDVNRAILGGQIVAIVLLLVLRSILRSRR